MSMYACGPRNVQLDNQGRPSVVQCSTGQTSTVFITLIPTAERSQRRDTNQYTHSQDNGTNRIRRAILARLRTFSR